MVPTHCQNHLHFTLTANLHAVAQRKEGLFSIQKSVFSGWRWYIFIRIGIGKKSLPSHFKKMKFNTLFCFFVRKEHNNNFSSVLCLPRSWVLDLESESYANLWFFFFFFERIKQQLHRWASPTAQIHLSHSEISFHAGRPFISLLWFSVLSLFQQCAWVVGTSKDASRIKQEIGNCCRWGNLAVSISSSDGAPGVVQTSLF